MSPNVLVSCFIHLHIITYGHCRMDKNKLFWNILLSTVISDAGLLPAVFRVANNKNSILRSKFSSFLCYSNLASSVQHR